MSAGLQTTLPLVLGLQLEQGELVLLADAGSVAITGQDATLSAPSIGADVGTSWPLSLGLLLPTEGSSSFLLSASASAVPITGQSASLIASFDPADVGTSWPLALGLNLTRGDFTLTADVSSVEIRFAPSESTEFAGPVAESGFSGGYPVPVPKTKKDKKRERIALGILPPDEEDAPVIEPPAPAPEAPKPVAPKPKPSVTVTAEPAPVRRVEVSGAAVDWVDNWARTHGVKLPPEAYKQLLRVGAAAMSGPRADNVEAYLDESAIDAHVQTITAQRMRADEELLLMLD